MKSGVLYLVFGESYVAEAKQSISSLRAVSPQLPIAVVTDLPWNDSPQPDSFIVRPRVQSWRCKPLYIYEASPFEETLFVDADSYFVRDVSHIYSLLHYYEFAVRFTPHQHPTEDTYFHPGCNSGVLLFNRNPEVEQMFLSWRKIYDEHSHGGTHADPRGLGDQGVLMNALATSKVRAIHLPDYFNFTLWEPTLTNAPPVILTGRNRFMPQIASQINSRWDHTKSSDPKFWLPAINGFLPIHFKSTRNPLNWANNIVMRLVNEIRFRLMARR